MNKHSTTKPPVWYWVVSVLALLWNLMGVMNYLGTAFMKEAIKAEMTAAQVELMENTPAWVTAAFAIAVWFGAAGCIGLLLRKKWAKSVLGFSLIGVLVQTGYGFFMTNATEVYGKTEAVIIPLMVITIAILLVFFARLSERKTWIA
ncbi:hypothetical protein [Muriicola soli]|uniref:Sugar transporter n=1 Tax=Muriicola soli TaxID=2507538 RepID=A0A411E9I4_9FLAO|nr:hypothetical protein [Muriicola soli]QBA64203.1 hypothetical protein EQY75_06485 [Muriicola soli]